jgi:hypothetical protein
MTDFLNLPLSLVESLINVGGHKFHANVLTLMNSLEHRLIPTEIPQSRSGGIRKISHFPDKENKVRIIGQLDY